MNAQKDSVFITPSRIVKLTWNDLDIIAGLDKPGKDTFQLLEGMLYAEQMRSTRHNESGNCVINLDDSSHIGNKYFITAKTIDFDSVRNHFSPDANGIGTVNGKSFYGTDGEKPKTQFGEISISRNGAKIIFPKKAYGDLYNPGSAITVYEPVQTPGQWYLYMWGSDGAGGYAVVWIFIGNKYKQRIVANGF